MLNREIKPKPCYRCHSTEHLHVNIIDDYCHGTLSARVTCTECNTSAQLDYVLTGPHADECRPDDVQLTREVVERWNEHCDSMEGTSDHE